MLNILLNIIKIAFLLGFLILIHELGHFTVAKLFKIKVKEFAIGFGPVIWKKQGKKTKYVLRAVPLGGFVNLLGEEEIVNEEGSYSNASKIKKILILVAGGAVNIVFGLLVYFLLITTTTEKFVSTTVDYTIENYAAYTAGLEQGDKIIKIDNKRIRLKSDIDNILEKNDKQNIRLTIEREGEFLDLELEPTTNKETGKYFLGIIFKQTERNLKNNVYYGFWDTVYFSTSIIENVKELFLGNVGVKQLTGPVGISEVVSKTQNISQFVYILALISVSLGVTNLLPFPPLDGGKILLIIIEAIIRKPIKENVNNAIQTIGFFVIMALAVVVTYNDVLRIF